MSVGDTARCHRECAREEVLERIRLRDNALLAYLGATGVVFGVALGTPANSLILLLIPYFALGASTIISQHDNTIGALSIFLTEELEPFVKRINEWAPSWESSDALSRYAFKAINLRTMSHIIIVSLPPIVGLTLVERPEAVEVISLWWLGAAVTAIQFVILLDTHITRQRKYRATTWVNELEKVD